MAPAVGAALIAPTSSSAAFSHRKVPRLTPDLPLFKRRPENRNALHSLMVYPHPQLALGRVRAEADQAAPADPPAPSSSPSSPQKQTLLEALDFSEVRSQDDAQLLDDARYATSMGEKMSREQYAALRRKIGGTYRDFFKDSIEVEGEFVDEGWVDKSCRFCKKDTASEPRTVDKFGRYAHIACLEKSKSGNFFTRLFGM